MSIRTVLVSLLVLACCRSVFAQDGRPNNPLRLPMRLLPGPFAQLEPSVDQLSDELERVQSQKARLRNGNRN